MSYNTWPTFAGRGWNIKKRPITRTIIETADGGQEFRLSRFQSPLYEFDIEIPYLTQTDYTTLQNFFAQQGGPFTPFLFYPDNEAAAATPFFTGDGVTTQATLLMPDGSPALFANSGATPTVSAIHQTDWQGRVALSNQPRTNLATATAVNASTGAIISTADTTDAGPSGATGNVITVSEPANAMARFGSFSGNPTGVPYVGRTWVRYPTGQSGPISVRCNGNGNVVTATVGDTWMQFTSAAVAVSGSSRATLDVVASTSMTPPATSVTFLVANQEIFTQDQDGVFIVPGATGTDYTQNDTQIAFGQTPAVGATEDWDGTYAYLVRFKDDQIEMTQTMSQIYEATTVTLRSVR